MAEVEAFGSALLYKTGSTNLAPVFSDNSSGCPAMLLGHNGDDPLKGEIFNVGPGGIQKGHALTFGRTRGGKGVSSIIPALLTYSGSMVVIDPKGENAWITAERRRRMGHRVVILDPWGEVNRRYGSKVGVTEPITKFNPLSALDPNDPDFVDDIAAISEAFILQTGNDPHWSDSARELTGGLIAAEVQRNPGAASMRGIRKLLRAPLSLLKMAVEMTLEEFPDSVASNKLAAVIDTNEEGQALGDKEMSSVRSVARTQTGFLDSVSLLDAMETDEHPFDLRNLATGKVTLYLVLPVDRLRSHGRWLRMILTLAIRAIAKTEEIPQLPVMFILDELGTISPGSGLSMIEQSYGLMAGLGIRIWAFLQDLPQLKRDYPSSWETFVANSSVIQLLNVADNTTAKYFSEHLGNSTINAKTGSWVLKQMPHKQGNSFWDRIIEEAVSRYIKGRGYSRDKAIQVAKQIQDGKSDVFTLTPDIDIYTAAKGAIESHGGSPQAQQEWTEDTQLMSRPVMFPWEVVNAAPAECIIIMPGLYNLQLKRFIYYSHPTLSKWARADPNRSARR